MVHHNANLLALRDTHSFRNLVIPRKAPAEMVERGLALMSSICMLLGRSVSFIQRIRLLVMDLAGGGLEKNDDRKFNINVYPVPRKVSFGYTLLASGTRMQLHLKVKFCKHANNAKNKP